MEKFNTILSKATPINIENIDTDQILISNIHINKFDKNNVSKDSQIIKNIQILKSFLAKTLY